MKSFTNDSLFKKRKYEKKFCYFGIKIKKLLK